MSSRRGRSVTPSRRGQSALLGLVLLIGMVATISVGLFLVAGESVSSVEKQSENERVEQTFVELSQQMRTVASTGDASTTLEFDAGENGAVVKTNVSTIEISGADLDIETDIGAIEYEGDDGTRIAYQAGGVFRETGNETQVVSAPPLDYDSETNTFSFSITEIADDGDIDSGDVSVTHSGNTEPYQDTVHVDDSIMVNVTSEYCVGWQTYFEKQTETGDGQAIRETCGDDDTVRVQLGRFDIEDGTFEDGVVVYDEVNGKTGGWDVSTGDGDSPPSLDGLIDTMIADLRSDDDVTNLSDVSSPISSGTYYAEELDPADFGGDLTFDLSSGNATVVVEEDIVVDGDELHVANAGGNRSVQIYAGGNFDASGGGGEMCVEPCNDEVDAKHLQVYGKSDMSISMGTGKTYFEGMLYAPPGDTEFTDNEIHNTGQCSDEQLCYQSTVETDGSFVVASAHSQTPNTEANHDPDLVDFSPELNLDEYIFPPELTYLNVAEHEVIVENE
ncbi:DUF7289 family protein [Halopiger djelfimassiliensis]|uniref:DUF7289 family protein n=1 Tax=Halopiger djelfimassiliensis TaxID=1293047 RepID=UPI0012B56964|nr:hypothetical protein [Halopiger djelfimassiliensis]